jgi:hypothetical protein
MPSGGGETSASFLVRRTEVLERSRSAQCRGPRFGNSCQCVEVICALWRHAPAIAILQNGPNEAVEALRFFIVQIAG